MRGARGKGVPVGKKPQRKKKGGGWKFFGKERNCTLENLLQFSVVERAVRVGLCEYVWVSVTRTSFDLLHLVFVTRLPQIWGIMVIFFRTGLGKVDFLLENASL